MDVEFGCKDGIKNDSEIYGFGIQEDGNIIHQDSKIRKVVMEQRIKMNSVLGVAMLSCPGPPQQRCLEGAGTTPQEAKRELICICRSGVTGLGGS